MTMDGTNPQLINYLLLLGFKDDCNRPILSSTMFDHSNIPAFQKIFHFLFSILLDSNDKENGSCKVRPFSSSSSSSHLLFRDCWPIIDKKTEAEFRKTCFNLYKKYQSENGKELPLITASLFQIPGGRKFNNCLNAFVRFVVRTFLNKKNGIPYVLPPPASPHSQHHHHHNIYELAMKRSNQESADLKNFTEMTEKKAFDLIHNELKPRILSKKEEMEKIQSRTEEELEELRNTCKNMETKMKEKYVAIHQTIHRIHENCKIVNQLYDHNSQDSSPRKLHLDSDALNLFQEVLSKYSDGGNIDLKLLEKTSSSIQNSRFMSEKFLSKLREIDANLTREIIPKMEKSIHILVNQNDKNDFSDKMYLLPSTPGLRFNPKKVSSSLPNQELQIKKLIDPSSSISSKEESIINKSANNTTEIRNTVREIDCHARTFLSSNDTKSIDGAIGETICSIPNDSVKSPVMSSTRHHEESKIISGDNAGLVNPGDSKCSVFSPILSSSRLLTKSPIKNLDLSSSSSPVNSNVNLKKYRQILSMIEDENQSSNKTNSSLSKIQGSSRSPFRLESIDTPEILAEKMEDLNMSESGQKMKSRLDELIQGLGVNDNSLDVNLEDLPDIPDLSI